MCLEVIVDTHSLKCDFSGSNLSHIEVTSHPGQLAELNQNWKVGSPNVRNIIIRQAAGYARTTYSDFLIHVDITDVSELENLTINGSMFSFKLDHLEVVDNKLIHIDLKW